MISSIYERLIWPALLFTWLRFRIRTNQLMHGSTLTKVFAIIGIGFAWTSTLGTWLGGFLIGWLVPSRIGLENYFLLWDAVALMATVSWLVHVLNEAQRGDPISLDKILHLPVSPFQAFVVNYLSSLAAFVFLLTAGGSLGMILGSVFSVGPVALLFVFPVTAFLFAMTGITYWLQGWVANLMANPRTKQMVLVFIPVMIVIVTQGPVQFFLWMERTQRATPPNPVPAVVESQIEAPLETQNETLKGEDSPSQPDQPQENPTRESPSQETENAEEILGNSQSRDITNEIVETGDANPSTSESPTKQQTVNPSTDEDRASRREKRNKERMERMVAILDVTRSMAHAANIALPPLWVAAATESMLNSSGLGFLGWFFTFIMTLVGIQTLRWSHRSTLKYWRGELNTREEKHRSKQIDAAEGESKVSDNRKSVAQSKAHEWSLPIASEETSAVFAMTIMNMRRAPEIKMYMFMPLLAPIILVFLLRGRMIPTNDYLKCLFISGFAAFVLLMSSGVAGNMFGYDRAGFRTFVLSGVKRSKILVGRNLAMGLLIGGVLAVVLAGLGLYFGLSLKLSVATFLMMGAVLPPYMLLMNLMAILTPFPMASGSVQPKHFDFMTVVVNLLLSMILPIILVVALVPLLIDWLVSLYLPHLSVIPWAIPLSVGVVVGSVFLYRRLVEMQGSLLHRREKQILQIVTSKLE